MFPDTHAASSPPTQRETERGGRGGRANLRQSRALKLPLTPFSLSLSCRVLLSAERERGKEQVVPQLNHSSPPSHQCISLPLSLSLTLALALTHTCTLSVMAITPHHHHHPPSLSHTHTYVRVVDRLQDQAPQHTPQANSIIHSRLEGRGAVF